MLDNDIRQTLLNSLSKQFKNDEEALIIEELGLCKGDSRVDVAIINGKMHGYEIKSARDSLKRLPRQVEYYNRIFDYVTVVASKCHIAQIRKIVPYWWGLQKAEYARGKVHIYHVRLAKKNRGADPSAIVQLLWRDEAFSILRERKLQKGLSKKPKAFLWDKIVDHFSADELRCIIRDVMRKRDNWPLVERRG